MGLAVALVAVAAVGPARTEPSLSGTLFEHGESRCLAQVVGLAQTQVVWFDGTPFFDRDEHHGGTHVYLTEAGALDPTRHLAPQRLAEAVAAGNETDPGFSVDQPILVDSGTDYKFTDANGVQWHVEEAYIPHNVTHSLHADPTFEVPGFVDATANASAQNGRFYTWIVEAREPIEDEQIGVPETLGDGGEYNFALQANTSKFTDQARERGFNVSHDDVSEPGFCPGDGNHTHRQYEANLWLGSEPDLVPLGCEPPNAVSVGALAEVSAEVGDAGVDDADVDGGVDPAGVCPGPDGGDAP